MSTRTLAVYMIVVLLLSLLCGGCPPVLRSATVVLTDGTSYHGTCTVMHGFNGDITAVTVGGTEVPGSRVASVTWDDQT